MTAAAFDQFATAERWVAWRNELRGKAAKPTKVPYGRGGRRAKADDEATWLVRTEAEALARHIVNGLGGGLGYELGDIGNDLFVGGVDLDSCLAANGSLTPWAQQILDLTDTYAEISPSGTGIKAFFCARRDDVRLFLDRIGVQPHAWGCRRGIPGEDTRDHGPAIEVYLAARYFALTEDRWPSAPDQLRVLDAADLERLAKLIPPAKTAAGSGKAGRGDDSRSAVAFRKGRELRRAGKTFEEMVEALRADPETAAWCREKADPEEDNGRQYQRIWDKADPGRGLPVVKVFGGSLPHSIDAAEKLLIADDDEVYQRGDFVVRPALETIAISGKRKTQGLRLVPIKPAHLVDRLTRIIDFKKFDKRSNDWVSIDAPIQIAVAYLERIGNWNLPVLTGIVTAPTLRPDGSILDQPGYDAATGILYSPTAVYPPVPVNPSRAQACAALALLTGLLDEFPFVGADGGDATGKPSPSRSVALSLILTTMIRRSVAHAPLHGLTAPVFGSGKSLLVDTASMIANGHEAPVLSAGKNEEEMEKRLGAALIAGDVLISFDNCEHPLGGALLCQALTQSVPKVRILGKSENASTPSTAVFGATGNNLIIAGDMVRRTIMGTLDPRTERPENREFKAHPVELIRADRAKYVIAALTVLRAYVVAGMPQQGGKPLGSFEGWSRMVRDALIWLGEPDPCDTMTKIRTEDPYTQQLAEVLNQWHAAVGEQGVSVKQITEYATERLPPDPQLFPVIPPAWRYPDLREALLVVAGDRGHINSKRLGRWLS